MRLIDADFLKESFIVNTDREGHLVAAPEVIIDNAPTVKPCDNCDLYFKAMTKEEMRKGGAV